MTQPLPQIDPTLRAIYLARLTRLVRIRNDPSWLKELNDSGVLLLDRCIACTYQDCIDQGAAGQAATIMRGAR